MVAKQDHTRTSSGLRPACSAASLTVFTQRCVVSSEKNVCNEAASSQLQGVGSKRHGVHGQVFVEVGVEPKCGVAAAGAIVANDGLAPKEPPHEVGEVFHLGGGDSTHAVCVLHARDTSAETQHEAAAGKALHGAGVASGDHGRAEFGKFLSHGRQGSRPGWASASERGAAPAQDWDGAALPRSCGLGLERRSGVFEHEAHADAVVEVEQVGNVGAFGPNDHPVGAEIDLAVHREPAATVEFGDLDVLGSGANEVALGIPDRQVCGVFALEAGSGGLAADGDGFTGGIVDVFDALVQRELSHVERHVDTEVNQAPTSGVSPFSSWAINKSSSSMVAIESDRLVAVVGLAAGDRELGAELVAEACARAWEKWGRVSKMANPSGWTYTVAMNLLKRKKRRETMERTDSSQGARGQCASSRRSGPRDLGGGRRPV
ncbi:hypothetical protein GQR58_030573 [Nymphon striatum]|nr:hypothetical protein GQR58_030573 [Nymphon striatum]